MNAIKYKLYILLLVLLGACKTPEIITTYNTVNLLNSHSYINYKNPIVYYLPRNVIKITVEEKKTHFIPGPYASYAQEFLGIRDVEMNEYTEYAIKNINADVLAFPDTNQIYLVENENFDQHINYIDLSPSGIIQTINVPFESDDSFDEMVQKSIYPDEEIWHPYTDLTVKPNTEIKTERSYNQVRTDSAVVKIPVTRKRVVEKSKEDKAEEAADYIIKQRKRKFKLVFGQYEKYPEGLAVENMVREIDKIMEDYLSLFIGKKTESTRIYHFYFDPQPEYEINRDILFKFSKSAGIITDMDKSRADIKNKDMSGIPVIINIVPQTKSTGLSEFLTQQKNLYKEKPGFHYRQPAMATIDIIADMNILYSKQTLIAQYGEIVALPVDLFRNNKLQLIYHPKYGSIDKIIPVD